MFRKKNRVNGFNPKRRTAQEIDADYSREAALHGDKACAIERFTEDMVNHMERMKELRHERSLLQSEPAAPAPAAEAQP